VIYTTQRRRFVYDTWDNGSRLDGVMGECTLFMTHCLRLSFQLRTISLVRTCRISSFCTVAWQLARLLLTRRIARSLGDSWASCYMPLESLLALISGLVDDQKGRIIGLQQSSLSMRAAIILIYRTHSQSISASWLRPVSSRTKLPRLMWFIEFSRHRDFLVIITL